MHHDNYPRPRTLLIVWLVLMILTTGTMVFGVYLPISKVPASLSATGWVSHLSVVMTLAISGYKSRLILSWYLDLQSASPGWNKGFMAAVIIILMAISIPYIL